MSANIIKFTEAFDNAEWSPGDGTLVVTPNTFAPPAFAGILAGQADTIEDTSAAVQSVLIGTNYSITADNSDWVGSIFIRKDAVSTRWPDFAVVLTGGSGIFGAVNIDTTNGNTAAGPLGTPVAFGAIDFDSFYWRLWARVTNDGTNNIARLQWWPSHLDALGGSATATPTGSAVFWGANMTNDSVLQTYQPDPFYSFIGAPNPFVTTVGAKRMQ